MIAVLTFVDDPTGLLGLFTLLLGAFELESSFHLG
jgi:hypothetical protein